MNNVYAIGEIVYDIIFRDNHPQQANPGGSMLNSAISLSRTGLPVFFIGEIGCDEVGNIIKSFLVDNSVNISHIQSYTNHKSNIALAFLNKKNDATYIFHKDYPKQRLTQELPIPINGDIVLFGSSFALQSETRKPLLQLLHNAKTNGATIIYDPNFRKQLTEKNLLLEMIKDNISNANIVRGSDEDFHNLFGEIDESSIYAIVQEIGCKYLIITKNSNSVFIQTPTFIDTISVPKIETKSTIGAGDNFNAGLIYGLQKLNKNVNELTKDNWYEIINFAIEFARNILFRNRNCKLFI